MSLLLQSNLMNEKNAPYLILGVGVFLMIYIVVRPFMRRKKDPMEKPGFMRSLSQQRSVERQMESLLVELSEMSRQMTAQLDTRAGKLEALIKDADERIGQLQQLSQNGSAAPLSTFRSPVVTPEPEENPAESDVDERHMQIYDLADQGKSVADIAAALSRPSGEIELILALRRR